ncbi:VOC family protein [Actinoplanes sp. NPDC026619]|uniref:VOC family protein n=1 Tax=Actinoplanes sp. NPDC026619 TaxID=3155798 RepID=UPI0033F6C6C3
MASPFVWFDLPVGEAEKLGDFYRDLFGWTVRSGFGDYQAVLVDGEQPWAGMLPSDPGTAGRWVPYVPVDELAAAADRAVALGGRVVRPAQIGPAGTSVLVADPAGTLVALFVPHGAAA